LRRLASLVEQGVQADCETVVRLVLDVWLVDAAGDVPLSSICVPQIDDVERSLGILVCDEALDDSGDKREKDEDRVEDEADDRCSAAS
jgi:hypothetical protein